jgi:Fe-Mn family superoxide dismutase
MDKPHNVFEHQHAVVALPFDPKSLKGLSEKLMVSHWESNYGGAIKPLNTIRGRSDQALNDTNTPPYVYNGLKREQLLRTGSVVLHELYFANLGGDGKASADARSRIAASCGTYDAWETEFRKIGQGVKLARVRTSPQA